MNTQSAWARHKSTLLPCLLAAALVICSFPDVVFRGASFSMMDMVYLDGRLQSRRELLAAHELQAFYPEWNRRLPHHGFSDTGGAAWQSEPAQQFMRYCIYHGESPFWNPYSAAGSLGPEILADIKFSPFSILVALCGGSTLAFHVIALMLFAVSLTALFRLVTDFLELSRAAAFATGIIYLLNGYMVANLNSNVSQVYLYFPIALYTLFAFDARPSVWRFLLAIASNILLLTTTFMPTTSLLIVCIYLMAGAHVLHLHSGCKIRLAFLAGQWLSMVLAMALLAFLYFPILDSFRFLGTFEMYNARTFYPASLQAFLSFFTPKHYWESYNAIHPAIHSYAKNSIFHFGIIPSALLVLALAERSYLGNVLVMTPATILFVSLARIFEIPVFTQVIEILPFFRSIGEQYWWIAVAFSFPLVFSFGCEAALSNRIKFTPLLIFNLVLLASLAFPAIAWLNQTPGFPSDDAHDDYLTPRMAFKYLAVTLFLATITGLLLWRIQKNPRWILKASLIALMFGEMIFYTNNMRWTRKDRIADPPDHIAFLKRNIGHDRVIDYGQNGIYPELGAAYQIQQLGSMNMNIIPSYYRFYERNFLSEHKRWGHFCAQFDPEHEPRLNKAMLDMMAVKYVVVSKNMSKVLQFYDEHNYPRVFEGKMAIIYENRDRYPRAFTVTQLIRCDLTPDTQNLSPRQVAFTLDEDLLNAAKSVGVTATPPSTSIPGSDEVNLLEYHHASVRLGAKLLNPAVVVLTDCWHPGWKAYVNGQTIHVGKVNETFRGVALPAGEHEIQFVYEPSALRRGLVISGLTAISLALILLFRGRMQSFYGNCIYGTEAKTPTSSSNIAIIRQSTELSNVSPKEPHQTIDKNPY